MYCTILQFGFVCNLFGLFSCFDTNTPRPCSISIIGCIQCFLESAAPQDPIVALPFRPSAINHQPVYTALSPLGPPNQSSLKSLPLQTIFERPNQALRDSPVFFIRFVSFVRFVSSDSSSVPSDQSSLTCLPSRIFSNRHIYH